MTKKFKVKKQNRLILFWVGLSVFALVAGVAWLKTSLDARGKNNSPIVESTASVSSLSTLLALPVAELTRMDIARMNLLCAQGLPGADDLDVNSSLATLDQMAARVRGETERNFYRFKQSPTDFENSEGFFRMVMLAVVLAEDFQVHYAPDKISTATSARIGDGFFADAHDVFLHGLTGSRRAGTCSSLPVLQTAVGRRLGYPLKLVTTKGHLFVRWEDAKERFNIEAAGKGVNRFADDYYRHWPMEVSDEEVRTEGYLKSLTPAGELAVFLSIRGMCWQEARRYAEAAESFRAAARLSPGCKSYTLMAAQLEQAANAVIANNHSQ